MPINFDSFKLERCLERLANGNTAEKTNAASELGRLRILERGTVRTRGAANRSARSLVRPALSERDTVRTRGAVSRSAQSFVQPALQETLVKTVSALLTALEDSSADVRREAAAALGEWGDEQVISRLRHLLEGRKPDSNISVRRACVYALRVIGGSQAVQALASAAESDSAEEVRWDAINALAELLHKDRPLFAESATPAPGAVRTRGGCHNVSAKTPLPAQQIVEALQRISTNESELGYVRREAAASLLVPQM